MGVGIFREGGFAEDVSDNRDSCLAPSMFAVFDERLAVRGSWLRVIGTGQIAHSVGQVLKSFAVGLRIHGRPV